MSDLIHGGGILGEKVTEKRRKLDTFDLPQHIDSVEYTSDEVVSTCPITGQPDWYTVTISLRGRLGIESKSLKLYLQSFKDDGQFCEAFAHTIAQDVVSATKAMMVHVEVVQKPRGGVSIIARAEVYGEMDVEPDFPQDGCDEEGPTKMDEVESEYAHEVRVLKRELEKMQYHREEERRQNKELMSALLKVSAEAIEMARHG